MARLPVYTAQQGIQPASAPNVPDQGAVGRALQGAGNALQSVGGGLSDLDARYLQLQKQNQRYDTGNSWEDLNVNLSNDLDANVRNQAPGANGLAVNGLKQTKDKIDKWMSTVPADLRPQYEGKAQTLYDTYAGQYAAKEAQGRGQYEIATNATNVTRDQGQAAEQPDSVTTILANRKAQIDNMSVAPAVKATLWADAQKNIITSYRNAKYGNDPAKAAAAAGVNVSSSAPSNANAHLAALDQKYSLPPGFLARTMQIESGGKDVPNKQGSSARGFFQFIPSTARRMQVDPHDFASSADGAARLARESADALRPVLGREPTAAELYLAHQQGAGGAAKLLANPNASAASIVGTKAVIQNGGTQGMTAGAFANMWISKFNGSKLPSYAQAAVDPGTAGTVPAQTAASQPQFTQPSDPLLSVFTPEERLSFVEGVVRQSKANQAAAAAAAAQAQTQLVDTLQTGIINNQIGLTDVKSYLDRQQIKPDQYLQLQGQIEKRDKDVNADVGFWTKAQGGGAFNQFSKIDQDGAEAAYKKLAASSDPITALDKIYNTSGLIPESAITGLRGGLVSQNAQTVGASLNIAANALNRNPNTFTGVTGGSDIEKQGLLYSHLVNDRGFSTTQAVQEIMKRNTPEYQNKLPAQTQQTEFLKSITPDTIAKQFSGWLPGSTPSFAAGYNDLKPEMLRDYKEAALDRFNENGGDAEEAQSYAKAQMDKTWGISDVFGVSQLLKYPIEKTYPPVGSENGGYQYIKDQAISELKAVTGVNVGYQNVIIVPITAGNTTSQAFLRGDKRPPYMLGYMWPDEHGQMVPHIVNDKFRPDPDAAASALALQQQQRTDLGRPLQEGINRAKADQQVNPVPGPNTSFNNADQLQVEPPPAPKPVNLPPPAKNPNAAPTSGNDAFKKAKEQFSNDDPTDFGFGMRF